MTDWKANNWGDYPWLQRRVPWRARNVAPAEVFTAAVDGKIWTIRLNDFPDEPLYTLLIDGFEIIHFDDWPEWWGNRPAITRE
jgi:hypothetical protein